MESIQDLFEILLPEHLEPESREVVPYRQSRLESLPTELRQMIYARLGFPVRGKRRVLQSVPGSSKTYEYEPEKVFSICFRSPEQGYHSAADFSLWYPKGKKSDNDQRAHLWWEPMYVELLRVNRFFRAELLNLLFWKIPVKFEYILEDGPCFTVWKETWRSHPMEREHPVLSECYYKGVYPRIAPDACSYIRSLELLSSAEDMDFDWREGDTGLEYCECKDPLTMRDTEAVFINLTKSLRFLAKHAPHLVNLTVEIQMLPTRFCTHSWNNQVEQWDISPRLKVLQDMVAVFRKLVKACLDLKLIKEVGMVRLKSLLDFPNLTYSTNPNIIWFYTPDVGPDSLQLDDVAAVDRVRVTHEWINNRLCDALAHPAMDFMGDRKGDMPKCLQYWYGNSEKTEAAEG